MTFEINRQQSAEYRFEIGSTGIRRFRLQNNVNSNLTDCSSLIAKEIRQDCKENQAAKTDCEDTRPGFTKGIYSYTKYVPMQLAIQ